LGCTLYFALVGEVPFPGGTREEKARRQLTEPPRPVRQLARHASAGFCAVVEAMMRKDPAERLASAAAVIERLRPWTPAEPLAMPRQPVAGRPGKSRGRTETVLAGGLPPDEASRVSSASHDADGQFDPLASDEGSDGRGGIVRRLLAGIRRAMLP
ncbi:MAG: hypothetical protein ACKOBP_02925, partial [Planctomycetia bacterium]